MSHWESTYGLGHNYILNVPPSKDGIITPKMAAAAAAFGRERHRRYGPGSSDPEQKSEGERGRASGRVQQWPKNGTSVSTSPGTAVVDSLVISLSNSSAGGARSASAPVFDRVFLSEDVLSDVRARLDLTLM